MRQSSPGSDRLKSAAEIAMEMAPRLLILHQSTRHCQAVTSAAHPAPEHPTLPSCNECAFAIFKDYGYSNYTVEGTEFFCATKKHPADGFDRFYGEDGRLGFAVECDMFRLGDPIAIDVDREEEDLLTAEQQAIYDLWDGDPVEPSTYPTSAGA